MIFIYAYNCMLIVAAHTHFMLAESDFPTRHTHTAATQELTKINIIHTHDGVWRCVCDVWGGAVQSSVVVWCKGLYVIAFMYTSVACKCEYLPVQGTLLKNTHTHTRAENVWR